ncbi:MAG TPA: branched-chain amino acid ABC transporter permease [Magnetovibrio sp.]
MSINTRFIVVALLVACAALPLVAGTFGILLATKIAALALFAMSLDLLLGYTGLVSFGHAAFFGIGAYAAAKAAPEYASANLLVTLPIAVLAAGVAALAIGALAIRTKGVYFIMVTLAFGQMAYYVIHDVAYFGGSDGVLIFARPEIRVGDWLIADLSDPVVYFEFTLIVVALAGWLLSRIVRAPFGHVICGIRENEQRMRALGYNTYLYKLASFAIAGAFAGLAGYLAAYQAEYVSPALLGWKESGIALMMVILGGSGTLAGPALGAAALVLLQEFLSEHTEHWMGLMGLIVILTVVVLKRGLWGFFKRD